MKKIIELFKLTWRQVVLAVICIVLYMTFLNEYLPIFGDEYRSYTGNSKPGLIMLGIIFLFVWKKLDKFWLSIVVTISYVPVIMLVIMLILRLIKLSIF